MKKNVVLFPVERRRTIAFVEPKRNRLLSFGLSLFCFALAGFVLLISVVNAQNFVPGFEPPTHNPYMDLPASPMPPVINDDKGAPVSDVAPAPSIVNQGSVPCVGPECNIQYPAQGQDLTPIPAPPVILSDPLLNYCGVGFEIYPDSRLCNSFEDHVTCEQHYYHCGVENALLRSVNRVLQDQLNFLSQPQPTPAPAACTSSIKFGQGGSVWKARSENTGAPVLVLTASVCGKISNTRVEDILGATLDSGQVRYGSGCRAETNQGRYHEDFRGLRGITGQALLKFDLDGVAQCIRIPDVSKDVR